MKYCRVQPLAAHFPAQTPKNPECFQSMFEKCSDIRGIATQHIALRIYAYASHICKESASSLIQTLLSVMESHHISHFAPALRALARKAGRGLYRR